MGRVLALIPGHNEEELLPGALRALEAQTAGIWRVVVVSDNSTDATARIAVGWGEASRSSRAPATATARPARSIRRWRRSSPGWRTTTGCW